MKGGIGQLMKQAQQMQADMQKAQEEMANLTVTGESGAGMNVEHEYMDEGNFTVRMCATGEGAFGEWTHCVPRQNHVLSCDIPAVDFTYERPTILGWVALVANLSPNRQAGNPRKSARFRDALAHHLASRAPEIESLLDGER